MKNVLVVTCALSFILFALSCPRALAAIEGDAELLRLVANAWKANRERIETWTGNANIMTHRQSGGRDTTYVSNASFVCDEKSQAKRWSWTYQSYKLTTDGKTTQSSPNSDFQETCNAMFKDGVFYKYRIWHPVSYQGPHQVILQTAAAARVGNLSEDFDPFYYLRHDSLDVDREVMDYYDHKDSLARSVRVTREGDIVTFDISAPGMVNYRRYDLSKGGNIVERKMAVSEGAISNVTNVTEWKIDWQEIDGVFVPERVLRTQDVTPTDNPSAEKHLWREVVFVAANVNGYVDPSEFTLEALGVKPGDLIVDKRTDTVFSYEDDEVGLSLSTAELDSLAGAAVEAGDASIEPPADEPPLAPAPLPPDVASPPPPESGKSWHLAITIGLTLLALVMGVAWGIRKGKRETTKHGDDRD